MESRSDLAVEEQLVRKNSNRGASSSSGTPRPRATYAEQLAILARTHRPIGEVRPTNGHGHFFVFLLHETERREKTHPLRRLIKYSKCPTKGQRPERPLLCQGGSMRLAAHRIDFALVQPQSRERLVITTNKRSVILTLFMTKTKLPILLQDSFRATRSARLRKFLEQRKRNLEEEDPSTQLSEEIPEGFCGVQPTSRGLYPRSQYGQVKDEDIQGRTRGHQEEEEGQTVQRKWCAFGRIKARSVDKAFKKKAEAYINAAAANKTLEENNLALKQTAVEATKRAEQLERKWSEADQKLIEKDRELEALGLDSRQGVQGRADGRLGHSRPQRRRGRWLRGHGDHLSEDEPMKEMPSREPNRISSIHAEAIPSKRL
ncbi:hypothetical protein FNV43_RR06517 [Rhamnella rubrinervis]|uniref:Uncharacterized protein n=1 Tax=Rhamnella rubrinervis TaxID=2594499 RepID=A0A8K0HD61_9ROSA|nr:hypothetical protein FNV43_RR06517 [Rhamnella rubrinervis]